MKQARLDILGLPHHVILENGQIISSEHTILTNHGISRIIKGKNVSQTVFSNGYFYSSIRYKNKVKSFSIHRTLALAFIPNPKNLAHVNHKDGNKLNNKLSNLEWCSSLSNSRHSRNLKLTVHRKGRHSKNSKLDTEKVSEILVLIKEGNLSYKQIGKIYGVSDTTISDIKNGKTWVNKKLSIKELESYIHDNNLTTTKDLITKLKSDYGTSINNWR